MKTERIGTYEPPKVEVIEVEVEQGFLVSSPIVGTTVDEDMDSGGGGSFGW